MSDRLPMTARGFRQLREELQRIKGFERPKIVAEIEAARSLGDLSENAEYHAAKERRAYLEHRITELETKLARAEIIDLTRLSGDRVVFGATVTLYDVENDEEVAYQIVGEDESDLKRGRISVTSPIARALIGRRAADEVQVTTPKGSKSYEVVKINFESDGGAETAGE